MENNNNKKKKLCIGYGIFSFSTNILPSNTEKKIILLATLKMFFIWQIFDNHDRLITIPNTYIFLIYKETSCNQSLIYE